MAAAPKINLNALKENYLENKKPQEAVVEVAENVETQALVDEKNIKSTEKATEDASVEKPALPKINLSSIKKKSEEKKEVKTEIEKTEELAPSVEEKATKTINTSPQPSPSQEKELVKEASKIDKVTGEKFDILEIIEDIPLKKETSEIGATEKAESTVVSTETITPKISKQEEGEIFKNYESVFQRESKTILHKIKEAKIVQTRPGLVIGMIMITALIIGGLFYTDPQNHSLSVYKASLLNSYNNATGKETPPPLHTGSVSPNETPTPSILHEPVWNSEKIIVGHFAFTVESHEIQETQIVKKYKYNGQIFDSKEMLIVYLEEETKRKTKEKIREHLSDKLKNKLPLDLFKEQ